jgi:hypothetical protein
MRVSGRQGLRWSSGALAAAVLAVASRAAADEASAAREPRMLRETGENTTVIDAFDDDDPFDANLLLTFRQQWKTAKIRRETASRGFLAANENVARFNQSVSILEVGGDIGLFRDLALSLRLPIILSDARELSDGSADPGRLQDPAGDTLFSVPFRSPTRSGIDWFSAALNYAILNQQRDPSKPTWVLGTEARFAVGPRLHACNDNAPVKCPDPVNPTRSRDPGISRAMNAVAMHTVFSRRFGYVEPYMGFRLQIELPQSNSDFGRTSGLRGTLLDRPPVLGTFSVGTEVFPWERREDFQRVGLDFRASATYHSPGRDYSELFDALGSSQARSLRDPNPGAYRSGEGGAGSVPDPNARPVFFTGITDQQAFGSFRGSMGVTWQAGEYVKFTGGLGLTYAQSHLVTAADACNPGLSGAPGQAGPCRVGTQTPTGGTATGVPNPNHRPVIDLPGRRFSVDDTMLVDLWVSGVVMF